MKTRQIRELITKAIAIEEQTHNLGNASIDDIVNTQLGAMGIF